MASQPVGPPFKNIYHKRRVAESTSRACYVCCKPTPVVLVSNDGKVCVKYKNKKKKNT